MYIVLPIIITIISFFIPVCAMEQQPSIMACLKSEEKNLVSLSVVRHIGLYETYCKRLEEKDEKHILNIPVSAIELKLFENACGHTSSTGLFKEYYDGLGAENKTQLINVAAVLKAPLVTAHLLDCYMGPDIKKYIAAMVKKQSVAEDIRYCRIRLNAQKRLGAFTLKPLTIASEPWGSAYNKEGELCKAPLLAIKDSTAMWDGVADEIILERVPKSMSKLPKKQSRTILPIGYVEGMHSTQFSPDGRRLLACSYCQQSGVSTAILWEVGENDIFSKLYTVSRAGRITKSCFSPSGNRIVMLIAATKPSLYCLLCDGYSGRVINETTSDKDILSSASSIVFSYDSKFFLTMSFDEWCDKKDFVLWDAETGKEVCQMFQEMIVPRAGGFTPDLRYIIAASSYRVKEGDIYSIELYDDQDAKDIEAIDKYIPESVVEAYHLWPAVRAAENGDMYDYEVMETIKNIIAASVLK